MKKASINFILGFVIGAIMFGGTTAYAVSMLATPTTNTIFVNGKQVQAEAYIIDGRNYLQLRDMAAAVDFSVVWDGTNNQVLIDTSRGYDPNETLIPALTQSEAAAMSIDEMKAEIIRLTNMERAKAGLSELEVLPELMDCAQTKAQDFLYNHYFGHTSPVYGTGGEMIKSFVPDSRLRAENLMLSTLMPEDIIAGWMESSGHRANILEPRFTHIGAGITESSSGSLCWVVHFALL